MAKNDKKQKKEKFMYTKERADGTKDVIITKSPQKTLWGKIIICTLAILLGGAAVLGLIFVLIQA